MNNKKLNQLPKLLKREHILKELGISDSLYYKLIKENKLPIVYIGNRIYIDRDKLINMLDSGYMDIQKGIQTNEQEEMSNI